MNTIYNEDSDLGYFFIFDVKYPEKFNENHNDLAFHQKK